MLYNFFQVKAESEGMSNTIKANSDVKSSGLCHRTVSVPLTNQGNNTALLNASLGGMNSSGILFNNSAMNSGVLPHASVGPSISPVSVFLPHRPGIK